MKRVSFVINDFNFFYSHRFDLAKVLSNKFGYSIHIITSLESAKVEQINECKNFGIELIHLKARDTKLSVLKYLVDLSSILKKGQFDKVVYVTLELSALGALLSIFQKHQPTFVISGLGDNFFRKNFKFNLYRNLIISIIKISGFRKHKRNIIFQNEEDLNLFSKLKISKKHTCFLIQGNGIDMDTFHALPRKTGSIDFTFCYAGRFSKEKGSDLLIKAFKQLQAKNPNKNLYLNLCLLTNQNNTRINEESFLEAQSIKNIRIFFDLSQKDLVYRLHESNIFVMPSRREGLPKAALEGASTGLPIIASNGPGVKDTVLEGFNGWHFESKNHQSLYEAMELVIQPSINIQEIGMNSRKYIQQNFELNLIAEEYDNVLKNF